MALIGKDGFMHDPETGKNYAKHQSFDKKRKKRRNLIKPSDSDILFGLYLEKAQGRITLTQIADATGWAASTICIHAKKMGFEAKIAQILKTTKANTGLTIEGVGANLASRLIQGADDHQESINDLLSKTRGHFRKMKAPAILKNAKEIDTIDKMGRRLYKLDTDEQKAAGAPVLNVAFLMSEGTRPVIVSATPTDGPRSD